MVLARMNVQHCCPGNGSLLDYELISYPTPKHAASVQQGVCMLPGTQSDE